MSSKDIREQKAWRNFTCEYNACNKTKSFYVLSHAYQIIYCCYSLHQHNYNQWWQQYCDNIIVISKPTCDHCCYCIDAKHIFMTPSESNDCWGKYLVLWEFPFSRIVVLWEFSFSSIVASWDFSFSRIIYVSFLTPGSLPQVKNSCMSAFPGSLHPVQVFPKTSHVVLWYFPFSVGYSESLLIIYLDRCLRNSSNSLVWSFPSFFLEILLSLDYSAPFQPI